MAKTAALAIGAAMVAGAGALAVAMKGVIDEADKMAKMAQAIGVPIDELSRLKHAADLAGIDLDTLGKAVKRLSAGMLDASEAGTGPAARAFTMLGIQVRDSANNMRPASAVMQELAGRFAKMPNGVEKTALAMRIFGKSGADLIPLLNAGSDGLAEMYAEAEELGIVLDEKTGKAAEAFNDNLTRLGRVKDGIVTKITAAMLPALEGLTNALVDAAKDTKALDAVGRGLGNALRIQYSVIRGVGGAFLYLAQTIATAASVAGKMAQFKFSEAMDALRAGTIEANGTLLDTVKTIRTIWAPLSEASAAAEDAAEELGGLDTAASRAARSTERLTDAQREQQRAAAEMARDAERVFEQTRTPAEQYRAEVERLTRMLDAAAISQDTFNRAMREANVRRDADDPLSQAGRRIAEEQREEAERRREDAIEFARDHEEYLYDATYDGVRGGLEAAADGNLGQYLASRIRDALFDDLATSLTDMLRGAKGSGSGGAMGWISAAGSVLKSLAGGLPGFKTGGSFKVGGSGGADSQTVAFRATPGEMVDIRRPGQDAGGGAMAVHVIPSAYFDIQVEKVATPIAGQAAFQSFGASRQQVPADQARRNRFSLTGAR
jgi:hypothetical protein